MSKRKPAVNELFGDDSDEEHAPGDGSKEGAADGPITASQIDSKVVEVADKLADFVSKNGRHYEDLTKERNPGNTPFKFLWNKASKEYKYYEAKLNSLLRATDAGAQLPSTRPQPDDGSRSRYEPERSSSRYHEHDRDRHGDRYERDERYNSREDRPHSRYDHTDHRDRSREYDRDRSSSYSRDRDGRDSERRRFSEDNTRYPRDHYSSREQDDSQPYRSHSSRDEPANKRGRWDSAVEPPSNSAGAAAAADSAGTAAAGASGAPGSTATLSAMEQYMKRLEEQAQKKREDDAEEERRRRAAQPLLKETAFDRRKVVAVFKDDGQRGHHMDDFIPKEELAKFMAQCGDKKLQQQVEQQTAIGADNIGHKLLQKMGWKEGQGIGAKGDGITVPVAAVKQDNLGLGAQAHGAVEESDDPFEQYRKRMMLGYKYRPNPLGNPRRAYY